VDRLSSRAARPAPRLAPCHAGLGRPIALATVGALQPSLRGAGDPRGSFPPRGRIATDRRGSRMLSKRGRPARPAMAVARAITIPASALPARIASTAATGNCAANGSDHTCAPNRRLVARGFCSGAARASTVAHWLIRKARRYHGLIRAIRSGPDGACPRGRVTPIQELYLHPASPFFRPRSPFGQIAAPTGRPPHQRPDAPNRGGARPRPLHHDRGVA